MLFLIVKAGWAKLDGSLYWDEDKARWWESSIFMVFVCPRFPEKPAQHVASTAQLTLA